jgi:serine/threonine-protein kinase RIO1
MVRTKRKNNIELSLDILTDTKIERQRIIQTNTKNHENLNAFVNSKINVPETMICMSNRFVMQLIS